MWVYNMKYCFTYRLLLLGCFRDYDDCHYLPHPLWPFPHDNCRNLHQYWVRTSSELNHYVSSHRIPICCKPVLTQFSLIFFLTCRTLPAYVSWSKFISWFSYAYEALTISQWSNVTGIGKMTSCFTLIWTKTGIWSDPDFFEPRSLWRSSRHSVHSRWSWCHWVQGLFREPFHHGYHRTCLSLRCVPCFGIFGASAKEQKGLKDN